MRIGASRPALRARWMERRKAGVASGYGLPLRTPETIVGMPCRAQKVAPLANKVMFRPGR